ncbi:MAG: OmpA family protein [Pseudomonadota bacterium]
MKSRSDSLNTTEWALAPVGGVSAVVSGQHFMLANRETGRAHSLFFLGGGFTFGVGIDVQKNLSYTCFRTSKPVNFNDFEGKGARISSVEATVLVGYSKTYLSIYAGSNPFGDELASVAMGGLAFGKVGLKGQAAVHGALNVKYGNGKPMGLFPMVLNLKIPDLPIGPRMTRVTSKASETPLMAFPSDVMFAFGSASLKPEARTMLKHAGEIIVGRDIRSVTIEGHTDAKGGEAFNMGLSLRRAEAVKRWFVQHGVNGAHAFKVEGKGESDPIEPNTLPDGSDSPMGRAKNRRVEILFR